MLNDTLTKYKLLNPLRFWTVIFLSLLPMLLFAQLSDLKFEHITIEDGLSQSSGLCLLQDSQGFIWIGTEDGLNKYDGYNFKIYKNEIENPYSISFDHIYSLYEDESQVIWVGTNGGGLNKFDHELDRFISFKHKPNDSSSISNNAVRTIFKDSYGILWLGTDGGGLNRLVESKGETASNKDGKFIRYVSKPNDSSSLSNNYVSSIYEDRNKVLWVGTKDGLNKYNREDDVFTHYKNDPKNKNSISANHVTSIFEDYTGMLWLGTDGGGLNVYDSKKQVFKHYLNTPNNPYSLSDNSVNTIYEDKAGLLWVGTEIGLNTFNRKKNNFLRILHEENNPSSLSGNRIMTIAETVSGKILLGNYNGGFDIYNKNQKKFKHFRKNLSDPSSLRDNVVYAFYEDINRTIWVGTSNGMELFQRDNGKFIHFENNVSDKNSIGKGFVTYFDEDKDGNLWIATFGSGVARYDRKNNTFKYFKNISTDPNSLSYDYLRSIYIDKKNVLWVGTFGAGLDKLDLNTLDEKHPEFIHYSNDLSESDSLDDNYIFSFYEEEDGTLWVGTYGGLNLLNREKGTFKRHPFSYKGKIILDKYAAFCIKKSDENTFWIGSKKGLLKFDKKSGSFTEVFQEKDGLPNNVVYGILEDEENNLWLSTNKGLSNFNPDNKTFINYDTSDGIQSNEFNACAFLKSTDGEFFFGGINGFNSFFSKDIVPDKFKPPVVITDFKILNESVTISENSPLKKHISDTEEITLTHKDNIFSLAFTALEYTYPKKNKYKYKLHNFEEKWQYTTDNLITSYTNLDPGEYVFIVKATNNDGYWNEEGVSLNITILPPWWLTWWAKLLYVITAVLLVLGLIRYRTANLIKHKKILEQTVEMRTVKVVSTLNKLKNTQEQLVQSEKMAALGILTAGVAHEINNPINFISSGAHSLGKDFKDLLQLLNSLKALPQDGESIKERSEIIRKLEEEYAYDELIQYIPQTIEDIKEGVNRTTEIIKGLLLYSRSDASELQKADIHESIDASLVLLKDKFKYTIKIVKKYDFTIEKIECYPGQLIQVFTNLIDNAIDAINNKGTITITTVLKNKQAVISIKDTGVGIPNVIITKLFDPFFTTKEVGKGTGLGLSICQGIINNHKGSIAVNSKIGNGTEFIITLPINFKQEENGA